MGGRIRDKINVSKEIDEYAPTHSDTTQNAETIPMHWQHCSSYQLSTDSKKAERKS